LSGVLNGVDEAVWNPATDARISHHFDAKRLKGKAECKAGLQAQLGLAVKPDAPLLVIVSRLTEQKGLHLMLHALPHWIERGGQFALLGSGDAWMESAFRTAAQARPESVAVRIGYDEDFAHSLVAAGDLIGVPSHFEPCGLTQLYGLTYGTLPLVRRVGGLADTVTDCSLENLVDGTATGVVFDEFSVDGLVRAMRRAVALYSRPTDWRAVQRTAMAQPCGWGEAADAYIALYRNLGA
jgi:starch synthase